MSFDDGLETRRVYLDISNAFHKIEQNSISGDVLRFATDFLFQRKQSIVLNGTDLSWANVEVGVLQESILKPLFFLININDLSDGLTSSPKLFADDRYFFILYCPLCKFSSNEFE